MLNLDDLSTGHGANFFSVSGIKLKRAPDEYDDDYDGLHCLHRRAGLDSVGTRSVTTPWEFEFSSLASSQAQHFHPQLSDFAASDSSQFCSRADRPYQVTNDASFAILGDMSRLSSMESGIRYPTATLRTTSRRRRFVYALVGVMILLCLAVHVLGLVVFFTPWYYHTIQVSIFRRFYSSFLGSGFQQSVKAKRDAVAVVYLLVVGMTPTIIAASLWFTFSLESELRRAIEIPRLLRHKPVLFSRWKALYVDASWGEIVLLVLLLVSNGLIFILSLLRSNTEMASPTEKIWRDVGVAFAFNAVFNTVWLLVFIPKPSRWTIYLDFFGITNPDVSAKYRNWFGLLAVACSALHAFCIAMHFQLIGELTSRLFPSTRVFMNDPNAGMIVFGEIAYSAMIVLTVVHILGRRLPLSVAYFLYPVGGLVLLLALCVHYPIAIVWLLPTLMLLLIQKAVAWTHSRYPVELVDMAPLPNGITRLVLRRTIDKMDTSGCNFVAGQCVNIRLPQASWMQWIRCTIATSPTRSPGVFTIYVHTPATDKNRKKNQATLPRRVHDIAKVAYAAKKPPIVYVDGFYGPTHPMVYEQYRCLVFIAGETGIVEMLSILEQLYHEAWLSASSSVDSKIARELGESDDDNHLRAGYGRPNVFDKQVWLLWTSEDVCLFKEFEDIFFRIKTLDPNEIHFKMRFFLTKIPHHDDLQYQRLPLAGFRCSGFDQSETKSVGRGLLNDDEAANPCRRPRSLQPQNRSSLSCWSSRPFHQSLSGIIARALTLVIVTGCVIPLSVLTEWHAFRARTAGEFPIIQLLRNMALLLVACIGLTCLIGIANDGILGCQRKRQEKLYNDAKLHLQRAERSAPSRGLKKLRSMARMTSEIETGGDRELQRGSCERNSQVGPDVMERLMIYSMQPDIDKFMRTVGRSFPSFAGTIGVFASGSESVVERTEASTLSCVASAGDWGDVKAEFDFHRLL